MKVRKGSYTELVLLALEKSVNGVVGFLDFAYNSRSYAYGGRSGYPLSKHGLAQAVRRMRENGLVEFEDSKIDQTIIKLTNIGRDALEDLSIDNDEWDGIWRVVIFDIPEDERAVRDLLRRRLKDWGFKRWQQSVWITEKNVTIKLRNLIKKLEIENWVVVIESADPAIGSLLTRPLN